MEYLKTATFIAYFILILEFNGKYKITVYHGTFYFLLWLTFTKGTAVNTVNSIQGAQMNFEKTLLQ